MTEKTHNTSMEKKQATISFTDRLSIQESCGKPVSQVFMNDLCEYIQEWSFKETSLRFKDLLCEIRMPSQTFYNLVNEYPIIKQEYEWALDKIAHRREIGAMTRKFDAASALRMMPRYDSEWLENEQKLADMKKSAEKTGTETVRIITVIQKDIPDSPLVPVLKKDEDE